MIFWACTSSGETATASSSTVSSPAAAVSCGRNPMVAFFSTAIVPLSGETSPSRSANKVDFPAPLGPTNPIRSPRLTWSDTSSKSARPAKDSESCETVSIAESAQCPLVRCRAQPPVARSRHRFMPASTSLFRHTALRKLRAQQCPTTTGIGLAQRNQHQADKKRSVRNCTKQDENIHPLRQECRLPDSSGTLNTRHSLPNPERQRFYRAGKKFGADSGEPQR